MQAGKLNRRVVVQQRTATTDSLGQPVETWTTLATVWGDVRFQRGLAGLESIQAGATTSLTRASIRIRYRTDITAAMRVVEGGKTYNIIGVLPQGREALDLACEVVN